MLASTVPLLGQQNASSEGNKEEKMSPLTQSILTTLMFVIKLFSGAVSNKTLSLLELVLISFFCVNFQNLLARELLTPPFLYCWSN